MKASENEHAHSGSDAAVRTDTDDMSARLRSTVASRAQSRELHGLLGSSAESGVQVVQPMMDARMEQNTLRADPEAPGLVRRAAANGIGGSGGKMPHLAAIQQAFGPSHDLSSIRAHIGGRAAQACETMGASAYTSGDDVAFKTAPDLQTAAHEAAHVVQQRSGVQLKGGVGQKEDAYEQTADAVADRVASGRSASDLLGGGSGQAAGGEVQHYLEGTMSSGKKVRVSEDWNLVVAQDSIFGSHDFWAPPGMISASSSALAANKSVIRLHAGSGGVRIPKKDGSGKQVLAKVEPENVANKTRGDDMLLWADCGRSSGAVMGDTNRVAVFTTDDGTTFITKGGGPAKMKCEIILKLLPDKVDMGRINKLVGQRNQAYKMWVAAANEGEKEKAKKMYMYVEYMIEQECLKALDKLTPEEHDEFDKKAGIDKYAKPQVGEGFTMSSGGKPRAGYEKNTWNFHWAGVIMVGTDGQDHVTLENYAVGDYDAENKEWVIQIYGSKKGQTFHEHHDEIHKQHGEKPTTMRVATAEAGRKLITGA